MPVCFQTDLTDQGSCGGLPHPRGSREQGSFVSCSVIFPSSKLSEPCDYTARNDTKHMLVKQKLN